MVQDSSNKKGNLARFWFGYVCLVLAQALGFIFLTLQPSYRISSLNSNAYCLTGFLIVVGWQTLVVALLSWTPRHWWLPISKLILITCVYFAPLTVTMIVGPAAIAAAPFLLQSVNSIHFNPSYFPLNPLHRGKNMLWR